VVFTAAEKDKARGDICYDRCLSELLRIGSEGFAELVAAAASARAAYDTSNEIVGHITRKEEALRLCRFILQRPVKDLFSPLVVGTCGCTVDIQLVSSKRPEEEVKAAGRWASDYNIESLLPEASCNNLSRCVSLSVLARGPGSNYVLSANVCVADSSWRRVFVDVATLLNNYEELMPFGLEILGEIVRPRRAFANPLMARDTIDMFVYAFLAASRRDRWFAGLTELVSLVASVFRAALPEMMRTRRIELGHLGLPFAEEEAERAKMAALAAYMAAVEAINSGDMRPVAELLKNSHRTEGTSAGTALYTFLRWKNTRENIAWARKRLGSVLTRSAMLRAAAEVLASLADDI